MRREFLFNILMDYEIPFLSNNDKTFFILLDEKTVICSEKLSEEVEGLFNKKSYQIFLRLDGEMESSLLSTILMIPEIYEKYDIIEL